MLEGADDAGYFLKRGRWHVAEPAGNLTKVKYDGCQKNASGATAQTHSRLLCPPRAGVLCVFKKMRVVRRGALGIPRGVRN